jgi:hypothetical protein
MGSISRSLLMVMAVSLALSFSSRLAHADSQTVTGCSNCNGYSFTASITQVGTSSTYQIIYTITNNTGLASTPYNWSLTAFDNGDSVAIPTNDLLTVTGSNGVDYSSDYQVLAGKTNNGNGECNGTISSAFCVKQSGTVGLPVLNTGQSLTFTFDITCTGCALMGSWDFLGSGNPVGKTTGNVYAISTWGTPTSVPEPSVAFLYASTLAVGLVLAWRSQARRRSTKT